MRPWVAGAHTSQGGSPLSLRAEVVSTVKAEGYRHMDEPVQLASGEWSQDFIDGKRALANGEDLEKACRVMLELVDGIPFDAVGGLTLGADQFAHVLAVLARRQWFVVRKAVKGRGTNKRVEGADLGAGVRILLVDDVVTTGSSIREAYDVIVELGAEVAAAVTLVDRGDIATAMFTDLGVPYFSVATYRDLEIKPVGGGLVNA